MYRLKRLRRGQATLGDGKGCSGLCPRLTHPFPINQVLVKNPGREMYKMFVPDVKAFFESHASKPGDTRICKGKIERNKPMYRPEFDFTKSLVAPEDVKNIKMTLAAPE